MPDDRERADRIEELELLLAEQPNSDRFADLAELLVTEGRHRDAVRLCETGIGFHPELAVGHLAYGKALVVGDKLGEGIQAFERACALKSHDVGIWTEVAQFLVESGHREAAQPYLDKAVDLAPDDPRVLRLQSALGPPPRVDHERIETRPINVDDMAGDLARSATGFPPEQLDADAPGADDKYVSWGPWDSQPPPPSDAFPEEEEEELESLDNHDPSEPPTLYEENPLAATPDDDASGSPAEVEDPAQEDAELRVAQETILDPSAGLRSEVSDAVDRAASDAPGAPPTMFDPGEQPGEVQRPWDSISATDRSAKEEPPTMFEGSQEARKQINAEPPPTKFTTSPDGAIAPFREVVATPAETFSYLKVFLVLIPFLVAGLALGGYVAFKHIRSEKISTLLDQALSSMAMDTFHGYNEARTTLGELLELEEENPRGKSLLALVNSRIHAEFGPNVSLMNESRSLMDQVLALTEPQPIDVDVDLLWTRFHLGDDAELEKAVTTVLDKAPGKQELLALAGEISARRGRVDEALAHLEKSLQADPSRVRSLYAVALLQRSRSDKKATDRLLDALALNGIHVKSLLALSHMRIEKKLELSRTRADLEKVIELPQVTDRRRAKAYLLLARLQFLRFERAGGVADVKAAAKLLPDDTSFLESLAVLCAEFHVLDEAATLAARVLKERPGDMRTRLLLIGTDLPRDRAEHALGELESLVGKKVPAAKFLVLRGEALFKLGRLDAAVTDLERVPPDAAERKLAQALASMAHLGKGDPKTAYRVAAELINKHPDFAMGQVALGKYRLSKRMQRSASAAFAKAVENDPYCYQALTELAWIAFGNRKTDQAAELATKALQANPHDVRARRLLGRLKLDAGQPEEALEEFARMVQELPSSQSGFAGMAEALLRLGQHEKALKAIKKAEKAGAADARTFHLEGRIHLAMGRLFPAKRVLVKADKLDPKNAQILADLGLAQLGTRSITRAERSFKESLRRDRLPRAQEGQARLYMIRGKYRDAAKAYEKAAVYAKRKGWSDLEVARLYTDGGLAWFKDKKTPNRYGRARRLFRFVADLKPKDPEPLYLIAEGWDRDEKLKSARKAYLKVLEMDSNHAKSLYRLGLIEFDEENDDKAKDYLTRFLETKPAAKEARRARKLLNRIK